MSARITIHFWSRQGVRFAYTDLGWMPDGDRRPITFTSCADARRFALGEGWRQRLGVRLFLRYEQAGNVEHMDLWRDPQAKPLAPEGRPVLALALAAS